LLLLSCKRRREGVAVGVVFPGPLGIKADDGPSVTHGTFLDLQGRRVLRRLALRADFLEFPGVGKTLCLLVLLEMMRVCGPQWTVLGKTLQKRSA